MGRYLGPSCKLCRREGTPLMLKGKRCNTDKCAIKKKKYPPGPPKKRRSKFSEYGQQLRAKQKIKRFYGLYEKQFRIIYHKSTRMKGITGDNMLCLLERRLDNTIYKMGFASSRKQARQLIHHTHFLVDNKIVNIPSYKVKEGSIIEPKPNYIDNIMLNESIKLSKAIGSIPDWVEIDFENKKGKILRLPIREDIKEIFNEQLVVELYSK